MTNLQSELGIRGQITDLTDAGREMRRLQDGRSVQPFTPSWVRFTIRAADAQAILNTAGAVATYDHPWYPSIGHACIMGGGFDVTTSWTPFFGSGNVKVQLIDSNALPLSNNKSLNGVYSVFPSWDLAGVHGVYEGRPLYTATEQLYLRFTVTAATMLNGFTAVGDLRIWVLTSRLDQRS